MTRDGLTSLLGWGVGATAGWTVDPFLPLAAAVGLNDRWPPELRLSVTALLAACSAPLAAEGPLSAMVRFLAVCLAAIALSASWRDGRLTRLAAAACGLPAAGLVAAVVGPGSVLVTPASAAFLVVHAVLGSAPR